MTKINVVSLVVLAVLLVVGVYTLTGSNKAESYVGIGEENFSTTTANMGVGMTQVFVGPGVLTAIVVGSSSAKTITVWDAATSTSASTTDPLNASTSPISLGTSPANGTYLYKVTLSKGLVIQLPTGFSGSYTFTYLKQGF
jgi:hypothetical protein